MRLTQLLRLPAGLLAAAMLVAATACDEKNDNDHKGSDVTLEVTADAVTLGAESGAEATVGLTTTARWSATLSGGGFALDPQTGTGDATLGIRAPAENGRASGRKGCRSRWSPSHQTKTRQQDPHQLTHYITCTYLMFSVRHVSTWSTLHLV